MISSVISLYSINFLQISLTNLLLKRLKIKKNLLYQSRHNSLAIFHHNHNFLLATGSSTIGTGEHKLTPPDITQAFRRESLLRQLLSGEGWRKEGKGTLLDPHRGQFSCCQAYPETSSA